MSQSDWIALAALLVSGLTLLFTWWQNRSAGRQANMTAYLHRLESRAPLSVQGVHGIEVGYHLVLYNRGPRDAEHVYVRTFRGRADRGEEVQLTDLEADELPIRALDAGARYPIPWALGDDGLKYADDRRFEVRLTWRDGRGENDRLVPLRRGDIGSRA